MRRGLSPRGFTEGCTSGYPIVHPFHTGEPEQLCAEVSFLSHTFEAQRRSGLPFSHINHRVEPRASPLPRWIPECSARTCTRCWERVGYTQGGIGEVHTRVVQPPYIPGWYSLPTYPGGGYPVHTRVVDTQYIPGWYRGCGTGVRYRVRYRGAVQGWHIHRYSPLFTVIPGLNLFIRGFEHCFCLFLACFMLILCSKLLKTPLNPL